MTALVHPYGILSRICFVVLLLLGGTSSVWASVTSVSFKPTVVYGGNEEKILITLSDPAGPGGQFVTLGSTPALAGLPSSVQVPAGQSTVQIVVTAVPVDTQVSVLVQAGTDSFEASNTLTVAPAIVAVVGVHDPVVFGGSTPAGVVILTGDAGPAGLQVDLTSNASDASVPANLTVPPGQRQGIFPVTTTPVVSQTVATIAAKIAGVGTNCTLTINPPGLLSSTGSVASVIGGNQMFITIRLQGPAPKGGIDVSVTSPDPVTNVTTTAHVPPNVSFVGVSFTPLGVDATVNANVSVSYNGVTQLVPVAIARAHISSMTYTFPTIVGGYATNGLIMMDGAVGSTPRTVTLTPNDADESMQATVNVPAQSKQVLFAVNTNGVAADKTVGCDAVSDAITKSGSLQILHATALSATPSVSSIVGGGNLTVTIRLNGKAPAGGLTFTLGSDNSHATVPATVKIPAGALIVAFNVRTSSTGSVSTPVVITCTGPAGVGSVTANVTVN